MGKAKRVNRSVRDVRAKGSELGRTAASRGAEMGRTAVVIVGREVVPRYYSRSAVRHPHESRAALLIRSDGCVAWALPTGLITGLTVVSDSLGTKLASDKRCNPSGGY